MTKHKSITIFVMGSIIALAVITIAFLYRNTALTFQWHYYALFIFLAIASIWLYELWRRTSLERLLGMPRPHDVLRGVKRDIDIALDDKVRISLLTLAGENSLRISLAIDAEGNSQRIPHHYFSRERGLAGVALQKREPVFLAIGERAEEQPYLRLFPSEAPVRCLICIPLTRGEKIVGILSIDSRSKLDARGNDTILNVVKNHLDELSTVAADVYRLEG